MTSMLFKHLFPVAEETIKGKCFLLYHHQHNSLQEENKI